MAETQQAQPPSSEVLHLEETDNIADAGAPNIEPPSKSEIPEIPINNPKYAGAMGNRPMAVSGFLQKRLQKGQKFFDSGDYNVAKSQKSSIAKPHINAGLPNPSAVVKRNLPSALLLSPNAGNADTPLPVLTPDDLPHHSHPAHEASKLLIDQVAPAN